jgi:hypothetical protein
VGGFSGRLDGETAHAHVIPENVLARTDLRKSNLQDIQYLFGARDSVAILCWFAWSPSAQVYHVVVAGLRTLAETKGVQLFYFAIGRSSIVLVMGTMILLGQWLW